MDPIEQIKSVVDKTQAELNAFIAKGQEQLAQQGVVQAETTKAIGELQKRIEDCDKRLVAAQQATDPETARKSFIDACEEQDFMKVLHKGSKASGRLVLSGPAAQHILDTKTVITSATVGFPTSGVMPEERARQTVLEARRPLRMRNLIPSRTTALGKLYWPKVDSAMSNASPQSESNDKWENAMTFTVVSEDVKTIATWIPATRQVLEDWDELAGLLRNSLSYYTNKEEDEQILSGDNTGENLNGLTTQAQSFDTSLLPSAANGYTYIDTIGAAAQQIDGDDEIPASWVALNTRDVWRLRFIKDSDKKYVLGDPQSPFPLTLWGLTVVPTNAITAGTFLVGTSDPAAAEIRDRMDLVIDISTEHSDFFVKNKVAIRAEKRMALCAYRPNAFVYGSLASSPAY